MNEQEMSDFLRTIRAAHPDNSSFDQVDAIEWALSHVPKVKPDVWFGPLGNEGTFYCDNYESRWFAGASPDEVADILAKEMY